MKKILLTGGDGFVGSHLQPLLKNYEVTLLRAADVNLDESSSVRDFLQKRSWDTVIHLAGISHFPTCENDPAKARLVNVEFTKRLMESVAEANPSLHFVFASTAQVYESGVGLSETSPVAPKNVYSKTKWEAEEAIRDFAKSSSVRTTILRLFNHTHKTQAPLFFLPHIYKTLCEMRNQQGPNKIPVGDLSLARDIGSVRDLVRAIETVITKATWRSELFNICSGQAKTLRKLATLLKERLEVDAEFEVDPTRLRPNDPAIVSGSHEKLTAATGWKPQVETEEQLIDDFLAD